MANPFRYFKTSPEVIRLAVMMYVRFPLSLRNVEDLLHQRGIDISMQNLPDGRYLFLDEDYPLAEMTTRPAPDSMAAFLEAELAKRGITVPEYRFVDLDVTSEETGRLGFVLFRGGGVLYLPMPRHYAGGLEA